MQVGLNARMPEQRGSVLDTYGRRLAVARKARGLTQAQLARAAGIGQSDVSKLERGEMMKSTATVRLAAAVDVHPNWLEQGGLPHPDFVTGITVRSGPRLVALPSRPRVGIDIEDARAAELREVSWGELMGAKELPDSFTLPVDGQPLGGFAPGERVIFSRSARPIPGKPVLLVDTDGNYFMRRYVERKPGQWRAVADSDGLDPLDPERDGVTIFAAGIGTQYGRSGTF